MSQQICYSKKSLSETKIFIVGLLALLLTTGCVNGLLLTTPPDLQMAMSSAEKLKIQAENRVKLVNLAVQQGKINATDLQAIQTSYETARSQFSQWIKTVQNDLNSQKLGSEPVDYNSLSQNAVKQAEAFNTLVDSKLQSSTRGDEMETINSFIKAANDLKNTVQQIDQQKRLELISRLEKLQWLDYKAIT